MTSGNSHPNRDSGEQVPDDLPALHWMRRVGAERELLVEIEQRVRRRRRRALTVGSSVLLLTVAAIGWRVKGPGALGTGAVEPGAAVVSKPERRELPDGSAAEIREGARVEVAYDAKTRRVLVRQGEAHFQVVRDASRPFVVEAAGVKIRAVGTAFAVQVATSEVAVLVTEGRVEVVSSAGGEERAPPPIPAGDIASAAPASAASVLLPHQRALIPLRTAVGNGAASPGTPTVNSLSEAELAERLSWRIPSLEFSRAPLHEVVALMNQHAENRLPVRFEFADPELRDVRLSGYLRVDNTEGLLRLLEMHFAVKSERAGDRIVLSRNTRP